MNKNNIKRCGNCKQFEYEDINGYGLCAREVSKTVNCADVVCEGWEGKEQ